MEAAAAASPKEVVLLDATMGYVGQPLDETPNPKGLFFGQPPQEVHVRLELVEHTAGHEKQSKEDTEKQLSDLVRRLFKAKEERLTRWSAGVKKQGWPEVSALMEECQNVSLERAPGAVARIAVHSLLFTSLAAMGASVAWKYWRSALAVFFGAIGAFTW